MRCLSGTVLGTPAYHPPELVSGKPYGRPADAWALGICCQTNYSHNFSHMVTRHCTVQHVFIHSERFAKIIRPAAVLCIFVQTILGLYELASLQRPFDASNQLALVWQIVDSQPAALPPETPNDIVDIIRGLLQKDPCETECFRSFRRL